MSIDNRDDFSGGSHVARCACVEGALGDRRSPLRYVQKASGNSLRARFRCAGQTRMDARGSKEIRSPTMVIWICADAHALT